MNAVLNPTDLANLPAPAAIQQLETLGKSLNIHPLLTVLMIFVGGAVAGVPGLMLVLPVLGVVMGLGETSGQLLTDPRLRARR